MCVVTFSDSALTRVPLANQTDARTAFDLPRCLQVRWDTSHPEPLLLGSTELMKGGKSGLKDQTRQSVR